MTDRLLWRPLEPDHIRDPYKMYKTLRETDPVYLSQTGEYIVTRYDDVRQILKSDSYESGNRLSWLRRGAAYFSSKEEDLRAIYQAMNSFILMLNGDHHVRVRNFVSRTWNNRDVDTLITANVDMVLNGIRGKNEIDFVTDFAQPLPVYTIAGILGIPVTDCRYLINLGIAMTKALDLYVSLKDLVQTNKAAADFLSFFREQVRSKYERPDDGLLSRMIRRNREERFGLTEDELVSIAIFLFTAGEETSASLISNSMLNLLQHPDQLSLLRGNPGLVEPAIEEVLRYDPVVHLLGRVSREEVLLRGKTIPRGATMTLVVASANRDEEIFENADRFVITRKPNRHLSFGSGKHFCLGDWLARRQSQIAISRYLDCYRRISLPHQELSWFKNLAIRRLNSLRLQVAH